MLFLFSHVIFTFKQILFVFLTIIFIFHLPKFFHIEFFFFLKGGSVPNFLIEEVINKVQLHCPFPIRVRTLKAPTQSHQNDGSTFLQVDQKLRVRIDDGIPIIVFASRTETLESYLINLYRIFTTLPNDALKLRREMINDQRNSNVKVSE